MTALPVSSARIVLEVWGDPRPKGSKSAVVRGGRAVVIESKSGEGRRMQAQWAADVRNAAQRWRDQNVGALLDVPLAMTITFYLARPQSTPKRVVHPTKKPDWDKLSRLVCDALKGVIYVDDARIVRCCVEKRFAVERPPGCIVTLETIELPTT